MVGRERMNLYDRKWTTERKARRNKPCWLPGLAARALVFNPALAGGSIRVTSSIQRSLNRVVRFQVSAVSGESGKVGRTIAVFPLSTRAWAVSGSTPRYHARRSRMVRFRGDECHETECRKGLLGALRSAADCNGIAVLRGFCSAARLPPRAFTILPCQPQRQHENRAGGDPRSDNRARRCAATDGAPASRSPSPARRWQSLRPPSRPAPRPRSQS